MTVKFFQNAENNHRSFVTVEKYFNSEHCLCKYFIHGDFNDWFSRCNSFVTNLSLTRADF